MGTRSTLPADVELLLKQVEAREQQRQRQQGFGRPIISGLLKQTRFVVVGESIVSSKNWRTFHDFLLTYIQETFGREWIDRESVTDTPQHPLVIWRSRVRGFLDTNRHPAPKAGIHTATMTGGVRAYLGLAYHLYLLEHNTQLPKRFLDRLRDARQFHAAAYEAFVAASFITAGYQVTLEDERDPTSTHCEFTATSSRSGRTFSVEAKWRTPHKSSARVANQLYEALKKRAEHERVIFVDLNVDANSAEEMAGKLHEALESVRSRAKNDRAGRGGPPGIRAGDEPESHDGPECAS